MSAIFNDTMLRQHFYCAVSTVNATTVWPLSVTFTWTQKHSTHSSHFKFNFYVWCQNTHFFNDLTTSYCPYPHTVDTVTEQGFKESVQQTNWPHVRVQIECLHTFHVFEDHVESILTCRVESYSRRWWNLCQGLGQSICKNIIWKKDKAPNEHFSF